MNFVVDFYKGLDTLNLIIFWGVIIVVILLLIFSIIIVNKNKKLKQIINSKKYNSINYNQNEENEMELPIKSNEENINTIENKTNESNKIEEETKEITLKKEIQKPIEEEKKFIAEEHVMEYNKDLFSLSNIKKTNEYQEEKVNYQLPPEKQENKLPTGPYQRNVLREMSLSQTSPIGIVKKENKEEKNIDKAKELQEVLMFEEKEKLNMQKTNMQETKEITPTKKMDLEQKKHNNNINKYYEVKNVPENNKEKIYGKEKESPEYKVESYIEKITPIVKEQPKKNKTEKEKYLEEVSKKLSEAQELDGINRTEYELKQEEEAIISYEELMQKKDSIKMIDEEEAVISIEELMQRNNKKEKLYNLTEEEENDTFIKELKNFRSDL